MIFGKEKYMSNTLLNDYNHFVDTLLSPTSKDLDLFVQRLYALQESGVDITRLATATDGLCSESGELKEILKKIFWQGKPLDESTKFHMKRELGDCLFYWMVACQALHIPADEVIKENIHKLESRYPGGHFEIRHSELRKPSDI